MLQRGDSAAGLLDLLDAWQPTVVPKWEDREPR